MNTETENKAVVERYAAAVAAGDAQTARQLFAPTATWTLAGGDLPIAGTWVGRDTIIDDFLAGDAARPATRERHTESKRT